MLKFISFTSGSCGNCYYLGNGREGLLIDAGASLRKLKRHLADNGLSFDSFDSVLVTHDHLDHIRHLGSYCKKICKNVYATPKLHEALARHTFTSREVPAYRRNIAEGGWNDIGPFRVKCFEVPHDATQTLGYAIETDGKRFVIMTDIGRMTDEGVELASQADAVVVESNYDVDMLMRGPYPYELKMRIMQGNGHISNDECAAAIRRFWHPGLKHIFLCHLSENNNTPKLAYDTSSAVLSEMGVTPDLTALCCLPRKIPSQMFTL